MNIDIEFLKAALKDDSLWLSFAKVLSVSIASDRSSMRARVELLPSQYEAQVRVGAEYVAPGVGIYFPLRAGDLVLVGYPSADPDTGVLVKRLASQEDTVPEEFNNDKVVLKLLGSEEFVVVGNAQKFGSSGSTENLVLGQVFKSMMSDVLDALAKHKHICSMPGFFSAPPDNASTYSSKKSSPVDDEAILSDKTFTEK
jgi:hypothetical protein